MTAMGHEAPNGLFYRRACDTMGIDPDNNPNVIREGGTIMTTQTKHTPGPWVIEEDNLGCKNIIAPNENPCRKDICSTVGKDDEEEDLANARLIAAAPKLLVALKGYQCMSENILARATFSEKDFIDLKTALAFIAPQIDAAIAQTEGKE